ncbi:MAG: hypothetical protein ABIA92_01210 [Patescibacteria group bacterium]
MNFFSHYHRHLFRDKRLIWQRPGSSGGDALEQAQQAAAVLSDETKVDEWESAFDVLQQSEMSPEERRQIIVSLRERAKDMSQEHRDRLSVIIDSVNENSEVVPADSPEEPVEEGKLDVQEAEIAPVAEAQPGVAAEAADKNEEKEKAGWLAESKLNPKNWSEGARATAAAVGTVLGLYAAYRLVLWLWGGTKKAANKTASGIKTALKWTLGIGLLAGAGVLAYFGAKKWSESVRKIKDVMEDAKAVADKAQKVADAAVEKMEDLNVQITELRQKAEAARKEGEEKVAEVIEKNKAKLEEQIRQLETVKQEAEARAVEALEQVAEASRKKDELPPPEDQPANEGGVDTETPDPERQKETDEHKESLSPEVVPVIFGMELFLHNETVGTVTDAMIRGGMTMGDIWTQEIKDENPYEVHPVLPPSAPKDPTIPKEVQQLIEAARNDPVKAQEYLKAYNAVVLLCQRLEGHFRTTHEKSGSQLSAEDVSLQDFLIASGGSLHHIHKLYTQLRASKGDLKDVDMAEVFSVHTEDQVLLEDPDEFFSKSRLQVALEEAQESGNEQAEAHILRLKELLATVTRKELSAYLKENGGVALIEVGAHSNKPAPQEDVAFCVWGICKYGLPTAERIMPFFHEVLPNQKWNPHDMSQNQKAIESLIQREMHVDDAIGLFLSDKMMRSSNELEVATGVSLTQAQILLLLRRQDKTSLFGMQLTPDFYNASKAIGLKMTSNEEMAAFLGELNIPEDMRETVAKAFMDSSATVATCGGLSLLGVLREKLSFAASFEKTHPVATKAAAVAAVPVLIWGAQDTVRAAFRSYRVPLWFWRRNVPDEAASSLLRSSRWYHGPRGVMRSLWSRIEPAANVELRRSAGTLIQEIYSEIDRTGQQFGRSLKGSFRSCLAGASEPKWHKFVDDIDHILMNQCGDEGRRALETLKKTGRAYIAADAEHATIEHLTKARKAANRFARDPALLGERRALQLRQRPILNRLPRLTALYSEDVALKTVLMEMKLGFELPADLLSDKATIAVLRSANGEEYAHALKATYESHNLAGAKNVSRYFLELGEDVPPAMRSRAVTKLVAAGEAGNPASIGKFMRKSCIGGRLAKGGQEITEQACVKAIQKMSNWQKAGKGMRFLQLGGIAAEGVMVGFDIWGAVAASKETRDVTSEIKSELEGLGFSETHNKDGEVVLEGHDITISIQDLDSLTDTEVDEYIAKAGVDTAAMAGTTYLIFGTGATLTLGTGLVLAGAVVTVHAGIEYVGAALEEGKHRDFLAESPAWLLAALGTERFVEKDPYAVMDTYHSGLTRAGVIEEIGESFSSSPETSGYGSWAPRTRSPEQVIREREKREATKESIREKALQVRCVHQFASAYPDLYQEMLFMLRGLDLQEVDNGTKGILTTDGWFLRSGGAFERIVKPYIAMRLHADRRDDAPFAKSAGLNVPGLSDGDRLFSSILYLGDPLSYEEQTRCSKRERLSEAALRSMMLCLNDLRQKWYESKLQKIESDYESDLATGPDKDFAQLRKEARMEELERIVTLHRRSYGIFGQHPGSIPKSEGGVSFAERMVQEHYQTVEGGPAELQYERSRSGWGIAPNDEASMSIWNFERRYLKPDRYSAQAEQRLKGLNEELFMKYESVTSDEELMTQMRRELLPLKRFAQEVQSASTEQELKFLSQDESLQRYLAFDRPFHLSYLNRWRYLDDEILPANVDSIVKEMQLWKEKGYTTLIDENRFEQIQLFVKQPEQGPVDFLRPEKPDARLRLPGIHLAGYDSKPGRLLFSLEGYFESRKSVVQSPAVGTDLRGAFQLEPSHPFQMPLPLTRSEPERQLPLDNSFIDRSGKPRPLLALKNLQHCVAVHEKQLSEFMKSWTKNDELDALRNELLSRRVYVIVDAIPQPPSIRIER